MFCKLLEHHRSGEHGSPRVSGSTSAPDPRSASDQTQSTADAPHRHDEPALPPTAFPHPTPRPRAPPCSSRSPSLAPPPRSRPAHTPEPPPPPTTDADARSTPDPTPHTARQSSTHRSCPRHTPPQPGILPQPTNFSVSP